MKRRKFALLAAVGLALSLLTVRSARAEDAVIVDQKAQWEISYGAVYYRVFGNVQNKSQKPIHYVKLQLDLLDANGKSVYTFVGYNQKAEALGVVEGEGAETQDKVSAEDRMKKVEPLKPGEKDLFRLGVSKDDMPKKPKFKKYSLKIVEVK
jgi:hypothetical protein